MTSDRWLDQNVGWETPRVQADWQCNALHKLLHFHRRPEWLGRRKDGPK